MPERIVYVLESVHVDDRHGKLASMTFGPFHFDLSLRGKGAAILGLCQRVDHCQAAESLLFPLLHFQQREVVTAVGIHPM